MMRQLPLALDPVPAFGRDDFLVGACNHAAAALLRRWPDWPARACLLHGAGGTGKSHLVAVWRCLSGAEQLAAADLDDRTADAMLRRQPVALAVEDIDAAGVSEHHLFHLLNLSAERGFDLLLSSRVPPRQMATVLPDLRSRLGALPLVAIGAADETLLAAVLVKLAADRQLALTPALVDYVLPRIERSLGAVRQFVAALDAASLAARRPPSRALAADVLRRMDRADGDAGL